MSLQALVIVVLFAVGPLLLWLPSLSAGQALCRKLEGADKRRTKVVTMEPLPTKLHEAA